MSQSGDIFLPRLIVSSTGGGGGKTLFSLGLAAALRHQGYTVLPFKKGPDYIDAAWLAAAAGNVAHNLDPFFLDGPRLRAQLKHAVLRLLGEQDPACAIALIEGNRGLYDGFDLQGSCSTAAVSRELGLPIVLVLNVSKMTRTSAALLQGLCSFESGLHFAGVVLNQVGNPRHASYAQASIEAYTDLKVLGALPRLTTNPFPERHMGLASLKGASLDANAQEKLDKLGAYIAENVDLDLVLKSAQQALPLQADALWQEESITLSSPPRIGYVFDETLWFYYQENLEALQRQGATVVPLRFSDPTPWRFQGQDALDAIYLGGGFPEDHLETISQSPHLKELAAAIEQGLPVYAECGGLMLLTQAIETPTKTWPLAKILPFHIKIHARPIGLGYVEGTISQDCPYYTAGTPIRGHEFHYSKAIEETISPTYLTLERGKGLCQGRDGYLYKNTWASYTHIFAPTTPQWAANFVRLASTWRNA